MSLLQNNTIDKYIQAIRSEREKVLKSAEDLHKKAMKAKSFEEFDELIPEYMDLVAAVGMLVDKARTTLIQTIAKEVVRAEKEEEYPTPPPEAKTTEQTTTRITLPLVKLTPKLPSMDGWQVHIYGTTEQAARQFLYVQTKFFSVYNGYKAMVYDINGRIYSRELERKLLNNFKNGWCTVMLGAVQFLVYSESATLEQKALEDMIGIVQKQWETVLTVVKELGNIEEAEENVPQPAARG
jgi:hypothetical protein